MGDVIGAVDIIHCGFVVAETMEVVVWCSHILIVVVVSVVVVGIVTVELGS